MIWGLRPGEIGWVALLGPPDSAPKVRRLLPGGWPVETVWSPGELCHGIARSNVLVFAPGGAGPAAATERLRLLNELRDSSELPPVVMYLDPESLLQLRAPISDLKPTRLTLDPSERDQLSSATAEAALSPAFGRVASLARACCADPALRRALAAVITGREPGSSPAASWDGGRSDFVRWVGQLPGIAGCSLSHLERAARDAGLELRSVLRANTAFQAAVHFGRGQGCCVAPRLGFPSGDALCVCLRRTYGVPLEELRIRTLEELAKPLAEALGFDPGRLRAG